LAGAGISLHTHVRVTALAGGEVTLANLFTGAEQRLPCASLVIVGARLANDQLYTELAARPKDLEAAGIRSVARVGDTLAPGALVHAVYSGHRYARELDGGEVARSWRRDAPLPISGDAAQPARVLPV
jgi:dimethylamine/trimethylamine dehydrogenase